MQVDVVGESTEHDQIEGLTSKLRITFATGQTLAPNYNESIQIDDYLWALQTVGEFDSGMGDDLSKTLENQEEDQQENKDNV